MQFKDIELQKEAGVAVGWLNKPKANTYDLDLMRDFSNLIEDVRFDDKVAVCVIASKLDGMWSAGADINILASSTPDYKAMFCLDCQETLDKFEKTPKLFIAALNGHCVGGGLEIALACDLRFMARSPNPERPYKIGLPPGTLRGHPRGPSGDGRDAATPAADREVESDRPHGDGAHPDAGRGARVGPREPRVDRKSTRLNSSHGYISYSVF